MANDRKKEPASLPDSELDQVSAGGDTTIQPTNMKIPEREHVAFVDDDASEALKTKS